MKPQFHMNRLLLIIYMCMLPVAAALAQTTKVSGTVCDSVAGTPLPYATVRFFQAGQTDKPEATILADADGRFERNVKSGRTYRAVFNVIGMKPQARQFTATGTEVRLDSIKLSEAGSMLGQAVVAVERPVVRMETDKVTYDLTADGDAKTSTLLDMLRKVPLVTVDGNDNISVNGSSNFKVFVDGKPNPMLSQNASVVLKSIPASFAKNIEVITNPGAKYDAEGVGGILNITTNMGSTGGTTDMEGYSANVHGSVTNRSEEGSAYVTWQKGKFTLGLNASIHRQRNNGTTINFDREQYVSTDTMFTKLTSESDMTNVFMNGGLNLSYQIDSLRLLTAAGSFMNFRQTGDTEGTMEMTLGKLPSAGYSQRNHTRMRFRNISANLDYQRSFAGNKERFLTFSYQFTTSPGMNRQYSYFNNVVGTGLNTTDSYSDGNTRSTEHTGQIDFTTPIAEGHKLSTGVKFIGRINSSDSKFYNLVGTNYVVDALQSVDYKFYNDIAAAYVEYEGKVSVFKLKAGARYEHTWERVNYTDKPAQNFKLNYGNLVPSATLSYNFGPTQSIGLSYTMRISRPGIWQLNPYVNQQDRTSISYGNSDLDAEKTHELGLVLNSFTPKLIVSLRGNFNLCDNGIESYSFYDTKNVLNTTYGNLSRNRNAGANVFVNYKPYAETSIVVNAGATYVDLRSNAINAHNYGWQGNMMLGLQQTLWWKLKLGLNLITMTKQHELQGDRDGFNGISGSLTKDFLGNFLSVGITGFTPLSGKYLRFDNTTRGNNFVNRMKIRVPIARIGVTVTLNLGNMSLSTKKVNRSIENNDVKQGGDGQSGGVGGTGSMTGGM